MHAGPHPAKTFLHCAGEVKIKMFACCAVKQMQKTVSQNKHCYVLMRGAATVSLWLPQTAHTICSTCLPLFIHMHSNRAKALFIKYIHLLCAAGMGNSFCFSLELTLSSCVEYLGKRKESCHSLCFQRCADRRCDIEYM